MWLIVRRPWSIACFVCVPTIQPKDNACENDRGIPGSGHVDWRGVFGALHELRYDGWLVIESFGFTIKEIAAAACIWRDLAPSPEDIAFEGLKFLKSRAA